MITFSKKKNINIAVFSTQQLSRDEMKRIMAGSFGCGGTCSQGRCSTGGCSCGGVC